MNLRLRPPSVVVRRLGAVALAAAAAAVLSGCVVVKNVTSAQAGVIGDVQITATVCASGTPTICPEPANNPAGGGADRDVQLLIGYRVSAGATAPASLRFDGDPGSGPLLTPHAGYTAELQRLVPAPAGEQWFGYASTLLAHRPGVSPASGVVSAGFALPEDPAGLFAGPFRYRVVVGGRLIDATHPITAPVACGDDVDGPSSAGSDGQTVCIDSPSVPIAVTSQTLTTRDLALVSGDAPAPVPPAGTVSAPFTLQLAGPSSGSLLVGLSATTPIAGAVPVVSPATLTPTANSTTPVTVSVALPAGTAPGAYPLVLTANVGGETRVAGSVIVVAGPGPGGDAAALPAISRLTATPKAISRIGRARPTRLSMTLSQPGTLTVIASRLAPGRRAANRRCVAPSRRLIRAKAKRCTRYVRAATIIRAIRAPGRRSVTFSGRGRVPGSYRLTATVRSAAGLTSPARSIRVRVLR